MNLHHKQFSAFLDTIENREPLAIQRLESMPRGNMSDWGQWNVRAHDGSIVRDVEFDESKIGKTSEYT